MTLRNFHLVFITISTVFAGFLSAWTIDRYLSSGDAAYVVIGALSAAAAVALGVYAVAFRRRSRYW